MENITAITKSITTELVDELSGVTVLITMEQNNTTVSCIDPSTEKDEATTEDNNSATNEDNNVTTEGDSGTTTEGDGETETGDGDGNTADGDDAGAAEPAMVAAEGETNETLSQTSALTIPTALAGDVGKVLLTMYRDMQ